MCRSNPAILLAAVSIAIAATPQESAVMAVYKLIEKSDREADGKLYLSLLDRKTLDQMGDAGRQRYMLGGRPRPSIQYQASAVEVKNDQAVVIGKRVASQETYAQHHMMRFVLEDGSWKLAEQELSDTPYDRGAVYMFLPPEDGAFTRAGSPWNRIPYAGLNTRFFKKEELPWKMQAAQDESYLYIRFEAEAPLPAPHSELSEEAGKQSKTGAPGPVPAMQIKGPQKAFGITPGITASNTTKFDPVTGKATSRLYFVAYTFLLYVNDQGNLFDRLLIVHDRFIDIRIPLKTLGLSSTSIELEEPNSPAKILPYKVQRFR